MQLIAITQLYFRSRCALLTDICSLKDKTKLKTGRNISNVPKMTVSDNNVALIRPTITIKVAQATLPLKIIYDNWGEQSLVI